MFVYWLMLFIPAFAAIMIGGTQHAPGHGPRRQEATLAWIATAIVLTLLIGLRFEVGGDWFTYLDYLDRARDLSFDEVFSRPDPGYVLVNWISVLAGWDVPGVNLFCGVVFTGGLILFCRTLPRPWLALAVAVPYLVIVVSMGYSRQGVALGFTMMGLVCLQRRSTFLFAVNIIAAAAFHRTAVLLLPIAALAATRNKWWTAAWVTVATGVAYVLFLQDTADDLYKNYVETAYASEGALVRVLMNVVPAIIFLAARKRFRLNTAERSLWTWIALISIALLVILLLTPASTAVDRIALYMLPVQLLVFSHLPDVAGKPGRPNQLWVCVVVVYYAAVQLVWLVFATHSAYWLPYRSFLLGEAF
jgi:hypothetical protein